MRVAYYFRHQRVGRRFGDTKRNRHRRRIALTTLRQLVGDLNLETPVDLVEEQAHHADRET